MHASIIVVCDCKHKNVRQCGVMHCTLFNGLLIMDDVLAPKSINELIHACSSNHPYFFKKISPSSSESSCRKWLNSSLTVYFQELQGACHRMVNLDDFFLAVSHRDLSYPKPDYYTKTPNRLPNFHLIDTKSCLSAIWLKSWGHCAKVRFASLRTAPSCDHFHGAFKTF